MAFGKTIIRAMIAATALIGATAAMAQSADNYPNRVVKFIVPASAGGPSDIVARLVAEGIVDNAPTSQKSLNTVQDAFNTWQAESGRTLTDISRVLGYSVG